MLNRSTAASSSVSLPHALQAAGPFTGSFSTASVIESILGPLVAVSMLYVAAHSYGIVPDGHYVILALLTFLLTFPGEIRLYDRARDMLRRTVLSWLLVAGALLMLGIVTGYIHYFAIPVLAAWIVATPLALAASHLLARTLMSRIMAREGACRRAVLVGCNDTAKTLASRLRDDAFLGVSLMGYFEDRGAERLTTVSDSKRLGGIDELAEYARTHAVDHIYIALPMVSRPRVLRILDELKDTTASVFFVPDLVATDPIQGRLDQVAGTPIVAVCETPFTGLNGVIKRASDIVLALLILALIAPVMILIAVAVKLTSPGPVIFKQNRYGLDGRRILVYKFRSMRVCEDGEKIVQASRGDARITPLGAFLRRTSLDELPQFINVLQGCMSIVGPRPHAVAHNETYRHFIKGYMLRHKVKPGVTGWAQVNGCRGETDTVEKMARRVEYDLDYLRNWSLALDLKIILMTVRLVVKDANAY